MIDYQKRVREHFAESARLKTEAPDDPTNTVPVSATEGSDA